MWCVRAENRARFESCASAEMRIYDGSGCMWRLFSHRNHSGTQCLAERKNTKTPETHMRWYCGHAASLSFGRHMNALASYMSSRASFQQLRRPTFCLTFWLVRPKVMTSDRHGYNLSFASIYWNVADGVALVYKEVRNEKKIILMHGVRCECVVVCLSSEIWTHWPPVISINGMESLFTTKSSTVCPLKVLRFSFSLSRTPAPIELNETFSSAPNFGCFQNPM